MLVEENDAILDDGETDTFALDDVDEGGGTSNDNVITGDEDDEYDDDIIIIDDRDVVPVVRETIVIQF